MYKPKILLSCHLVLGLGHIMRTTRIAAAVAADPTVDCRILTGGRRLSRIPIPRGVEVFELPAAEITINGRVYSAEGERDAADDILERRRVLSLRYCREWQPDVIVLDYYPTGFGGEMLSVFQAAVEEKWPTKFVWGLPYGERRVHIPRNPQVRRAIESFHSVLAYAERDFLDPIRTHAVLVGDKPVVYTGFVTDPPPAITPEQPPLIVGVTGSGVGGMALFQELVRAVGALRTSPENASLRLRFIVGLHGDAEPFHAVAREHSWIEVRDEGAVEQATKDASVVVSRAGYNSSYSLIQTPLPIVFVPLSNNHLYGEQWARATAFLALGNVWNINERSPNLAAELQQALGEALRAGLRTRHLPFRTNGAQNAAAHLIAVAKEPRPAYHAADDALAKAHVVP